MRVVGQLAVGAHIEAIAFIFHGLFAAYHTQRAHIAVESLLWVETFDAHTLEMEVACTSRVVACDPLALPPAVTEREGGKEEREGLNTKKRRAKEKVNRLYDVRTTGRRVDGE